MLNKLLKQTLTLIFIFLIISGTAMAAASSASSFQISGQIIDAETKEPLIGVNIAIENEFIGSISDKVGNFMIANLQKGDYRLKISHVGYEIKLIDNIVLNDNNSIVNLNIELSKKPVSIKGITVTPGLFSIMGNEPVAKQILSRKVIETRPQFGEDIFRAIRKLPGLTSSDFSATFNVRGGEQDEVLITLDGMELYEPFHMKNVDGGALSIVDVAAVEGIDLMTGGYPANFGDRMSGVINIKSKNPIPDYNRMSLGFSFMNVRFLSERSFADGRGSWLVSGRRGFFDVVLKIMDEDDGVNPKFYDFFNKFIYKLNDNNILSANILYSDDDMDLMDATGSDFGDTLISSYGNTYFWLTLHSLLNNQVTGRTIASIAKINQKRFGFNFIRSVNLPRSILEDNRNLNMSGIKSDWGYEVNNNMLIKTGIDYKHLSADYYYQGINNYFTYDNINNYWWISDVDTSTVIINPSGYKIGGYLSTRFRFSDISVVEAGLRYDHTTYTDDNLLSPRLNLSFNFNASTSLKLGWGYYHQVERMDEVAVEDGETDFHEAQRAKHFVAGIEHKFDSGIEARIEGFYKKYDRLRPAFRNTSGQLELYLERNLDRISVDIKDKISKGIELYLKKDNGGKFNWWLSYAYTKAEEYVNDFTYLNQDNRISEKNKKLLYPHDQRHTIYFDANYRPSMNWQFNIAWQYHTGWPYLDFKGIDQNSFGDYYLVLAPWESHLPDFNRVDLRINRKFNTSKGTITAFMEIINILNHENIRNYEYSLVIRGGVPTVDLEPELWFGVMPSIGIAYNFDM
jgi:hypothetical protein